MKQDITSHSNTFVSQNKEYQRRHSFRSVFQMIQQKILNLYEANFITDPETAEFIEALITMSESKNILEIGTYSGFTTLHMIRAVYPEGKVVSIECRPDKIDFDFFNKPEIAQCFEHVNGWTPGILKTLEGRQFDLVFIDSDHSIEHTEAELSALWAITHPGTIFLFHDLNKRATADAKVDGPMYTWFYKVVKGGMFDGVILQTARRPDAEAAFGAGYSKDLLPHLGVAVRKE